MIKNKLIKLNVVFVVISLVILNILFFTFQFYGQEHTPIRLEFSAPITSDSNDYTSCCKTIESNFGSSGTNPVASDPNAFISVWNTTKPGSSGSNQIQLPLQPSGIYNFIVNWGDESIDTITIWNQATVTHTYASEGVYTINITGTIVGWQFNEGGDRLKILEIQQWGCLRLGNSGGYFYGCCNLKITAIDSLNLTGTTSLYRAFEECKNLGTSGNMNSWDVSSVTNMYNMFDGASSFNQPLDNWDVSSVTDMNSMFSGAFSFNQPLDNWDVSSVINMDLMFCEASSFNQPLGNWDVSSVTHMFGMFEGASSFNQPLGNWDVSSVTGMFDMFRFASSFNQPLDNWDVSSVTQIFCMFEGASSFNQPLDNWDVSSVTDMKYMFSHASSFNQPLGNWDVSSVTDMDGMFYAIALSTSNYDNLLLGWSQLNLRTGVTFHAGHSKYSSAAADARDIIITKFSWTIIDGGLKKPGSPAISGYILGLIVATLCVTIALVVKKKYDIKN